MLPTMLLSGYVFPIDQMPAVVQDVTYLVHERYYVTISRPSSSRAPTFPRWPCRRFSSSSMPPR
jgi:hypothetical protein